MRIAYLHYHLKTGGVTTVIRRQIEAVKDDCQTLALAGSAPAEGFPTRVVPVQGLSYDTDRDRPARPAAVAGAILEAVGRQWPDGCDLLHVHNPTLAKNRGLLTVLRRLSEAGVRLLCQVHDFAEDGRPRAYFAEPYPEDCHWAVINSRDVGILQAAGLDPAGVHLIPNAVFPLPAATAGGGRRILYPVRAIRRKNIGEAVLLSLFFPPPAEVAVTRPPNSPADLESYRDWKAFVRRRGLPVVFDVGLGGDFAELVRGSRMILTTSITEGFGFSFLEAWTAGRLLWGRRLPEICKDFEDHGVRLDHLYARLSVPLSWLAETGFQKRWTSCYRRACVQFDRPVSAGTLDRAWNTVAADDAVDFGLLDEAAQRSVICAVIKDRSARRALIEANPFLADPGCTTDRDARIARNRDVVLSRYAMAGYKKRLLDVYRRAAARPVRHAVDKDALLSFFLRPETFSLLKWCPYDRHR